MKQHNEIESASDLEQWHDEAFAAYQAALDAYSADVQSRRASGDPSGVDEGLKAAYEEARDQLQAGVTYWRQVGEQVGTRGGSAFVATENDVLAPGDGAGAPTEEQ